MNQGARVMAEESLHELVPFEIVPKNATRFAERIVATLKETDEIHLDFSVASLKEVDRILEDYSSYDGVTPQTIAVTLFELGCYVGEVIVRHNPGARWGKLRKDQSESSLDSGLVVQMPKGTVVNPIGKAEKRLVNGEGDSIDHFYKEIVKIDQQPG
jgi:hypothetical protein